MICTDYELLDMAAKAMQSIGDPQFLNYGVVSDVSCVWLEIGSRWGTSTVYWNPLTDDGDALRLAVNLGMDIDTEYNGGVMAGNAAITLDVPEYGYQEGMGKKDMQAATRRAIVRVAAEVGKRVK
jgi:hypothetical protein